MPSDIIDVITVTIIEDSISPLPAKSEPKQISPHNNITILIWRCWGERKIMGSGCLEI